MKNVLTQYPALRASIYGVVGGTLTIASIFGFVTQDQLDAVLVNTGLGLGAVGSLLAILNLSGKDKDGPDPLRGGPGDFGIDRAGVPSIDVDALAEQLGRRLNVGVQQGAAEIERISTLDPAAMVGDLRRQAERQFGVEPPKVQ